MRAWQRRAAPAVLFLFALAALFYLTPADLLSRSSGLGWLSAEDKLAHILGVAGLTIVGTAFLRRTHRSCRLAFGVFLFATYLEAAQAMIPWRVFELADIAANAVGACLGYALVIAGLTIGAGLFGPRPLRRSPAMASGA